MLNKPFLKYFNSYVIFLVFRFCVKDLGLKLDDHEIDEMIAMADSNGDGKVSYVEFVSIMFRTQN